MKNLIAVACLGVALAACTSHQKDLNVSGSTVFAPGSAEEFEKNVANTAYFGFDKYNLTDEAKRMLKVAAEWLQMYTGKNVVIEGRTDCRGTQEYNLALGSRRSESVKSFLIKSCGVDAARLSTISYGKESLISEGTSEEDHARNRQAHMVVAQ